MKMTKKLISYTFFILTSSFFLDAYANNESNPKKQRLVTNKSAVLIDDHAYISLSARWPHASIYVCWENPESASDFERNQVQSAISNTWGYYSKLNFKGWKKCHENSLGIRIRISDEGSHVKALGKALDGKKDGMVLNFTYNNWNQSCQSRKQSCNISIAVHEFGHALGFAHEHNRYDTPGECLEKPQGSNGDTILTPWDKFSVMNYCNPQYNNNGKLSEFDIEGLQKAYGERY